MSSTIPSTCDVCIQSPIAKGLSNTIITPPNKLEKVSCAISAKATPLIPRPVINPVKPNSLAIQLIPITIITNLIIIDTKGNTIVFPPSFLCILVYKKEFSRVKL